MIAQELEVSLSLAGCGADDVPGLLSLFAQGIAGRYLHLKPVEPASARGARGAGLAADGASLRLPEAIADFDRARHNLGAYRVQILHQLGYLDFHGVGRAP